MSQEPFSQSTQMILKVFFTLCVLIMIVDPMVSKSHAAFVWEKWPGFYGAYGFFSCVILVLIAKFGLRPLVMRDEEDEE